MQLLYLIQAIIAGVCLFAGITHLMIGLRSEPRSPTELSFALTSLLFSLLSVGFFASYRAFDTGSLSYYVDVERWSISLHYFSLGTMIWFIAAYTGAMNRLLPIVITGSLLLIAIVNFILPYPWLYTDIELTVEFPPDIVVSPWYLVVEVVTFFLILPYSAYRIHRQYRRGEEGAARTLGVAVGIYLITLLWDFGIRNGLIDTVLISQYGFLSFIVIINLRLSAQIIDADKQLSLLNTELQEQSEERTAVLSVVNRSLQIANQDLQEAKKVTEVPDNAKSAFLANMSHELRTPLNVILGFVQLMKRNPDVTPKQKERLELIDQSGEHLLDIINDVLQISKIEAGHITLEKSAFDIYRLVGGLERMLVMRAERKGLYLSVEIEENVPRFIFGDERKLRQVLLNLIENAIKYTLQGQILVNVQCPADTGGNSVDGLENYTLPISIRFSISDTGVGIAPEELDSIFEPFRQVGNEQHVVEGAGLGLTISQKFVELMGGHISVQSILGKGTTFSFTIPCGLVDLAQIVPDQPTRRITSLAPNQSEYRILVVDDSTESRILLQDLLQSVGFTVQTAVDGRKAVETCQNWEPHLIWMDVRMPVMDGYEATQQIKAYCGPDTVVIALTAGVFEEEKNRALYIGCDDFVRKPFKETEIFDKMAQHLGVAYLYEELEPDPIKTGMTPLRREDLHALPDEWISEFRQAAIRGRTPTLLSLINQIETDHAALADSLRILVHNLELRRIVSLTED